MSPCFGMLFYMALYCLIYRYEGTPLQLEDERLGEIVKWVKHHDLSVVKLDCLMHKVMRLNRSCYRCNFILFPVCKIYVFNIHFRMKIQVSSTKGEVEDLYPSFIAVSWHGPSYDIPLRQRVKGK